MNSRNAKALSPLASSQIRKVVDLVDSAMLNSNLLKLLPLPSNNSRARLSTVDKSELICRLHVQRDRKEEMEMASEEDVAVAMASVADPEAALEVVSEEAIVVVVVDSEADVVDSGAITTEEATKEDALLLIKS